eukprot:4627087-Alexandrium_andersonii.AAC.1
MCIRDSGVAWQGFERLGEASQGVAEDWWKALGGKLQEPPASARRCLAWLGKALKGSARPRKASRGL